MKVAIAARKADNSITGPLIFDTSSFRFIGSRGELSFSYANGDVIGSGIIGGLSAPPSDPLPPGVGTMLHEAGSRASRDTSTFMLSSAAFAGSFLSTYLGPAIYTALTAGGEAGVLYFGPFTSGVSRFAQKYHINGDSETGRGILGIPMDSDGSPR